MVCAKPAHERYAQTQRIVPTDICGEAWAGFSPVATLPSRIRPLRKPHGKDNDITAKAVRQSQVNNTITISDAA